MFILMSDFYSWLTSRASSSFVACISLATSLFAPNPSAYRSLQLSKLVTFTLQPTELECFPYHFASMAFKFLQAKVLEAVWIAHFLSFWHCSSWPLSIDCCLQISWPLQFWTRSSNILQLDQLARKESRTHRGASLGRSTISKPSKLVDFYLPWIL